MEKMEQTLAKGVADGKIPHAVFFAINKDGSFTYKHAVGKKVLGEPEPIAEDAIFQLASATKLFTSIAALQIVEQGLFGLDDDVASKLPELAEQPILKGFDKKDKPILEQRQNTITLRRLLTHTSGCAYDAGVPDIQKLQVQRGQKPMSGTEMNERFLYPLVFEPGTKWMYGTGVDWAGKLVERVSGLRLDKYMQKNMWEPLGINSVFFFPQENPELVTRIPRLTKRAPDGKLAVNPDTLIRTDVQDAFGGHGSYAGMGDYIKVLQSILANDGKLLKPASVETMFTPQLTPETKKSLYDFRNTPMAAMFIGENHADIDVDWGIGGILFMSDDAGRRKKGTLNWGGYPNTYWIIDREANLALAFGTQVLPPGDPEVSKIITAVEVGLYEMNGVKF